MTDLDRLRQIVTATREAQGLPARVVDPITVGTVAAILRSPAPSPRRRQTRPAPIGPRQDDTAELRDLFDELEAGIDEIDRELKDHIGQAECALARTDRPVGRPSAESIAGATSKGARHG